MLDHNGAPTTAADFCMRPTSERQTTQSVPRWFRSIGSGLRTCGAGLVELVADVGAVATRGDVEAGVPFAGALGQCLARTRPRFRRGIALGATRDHVTSTFVVVATGGHLTAHFSTGLGHQDSVTTIQRSEGR